jgi:hypothetical protein
MDMTRIARYLTAVALLMVAATAFAQNPVEFTEEDIESDELVVWTGDPIEFAKADGADPNDADNQDRITDSVWITRGNSGGQIYNAVSENRARKSVSPEGTLWAVGTTDNLTDLEFRPFRPAVGKPRVVEGKDLVLFIEKEGIFIDVEFTSWSQERVGGFAYERSTPEE